MLFQAWVRTSLGFMATIVLSACAGTTVNYTPPNVSKGNIETERTIDADFETVWDQYVKELSKSFFVINNISKESRIINVSFSANDPTKYANCGTTTVSSKHPARGTQTFTYLAAGSSSHWIGIDGTNHIVDRVRQTDLEGRANIYIAPINSSKTLLRANARYVLGIHVKMSGVTAYHQETTSSSISFATQETGTSPDGITCVSKGVFENDLLNIVNF